MLFSIFATLILVLFQTYVANKTNSLAIKADRAHYTVDFLTNSTVVVSLILVHFFGFVYFDVIAALFISAYLLYNAYDLAKEAVEQITDKELLNETGGVIQGMSGSPIIQNNKIVGAVTHVIVSDAKKGYGIFITTMLEEGDKSAS